EMMKRSSSGSSWENSPFSRQVAPLPGLLLLATHLRHEDEAGACACKTRAMVARSPRPWAAHPRGAPRELPSRPTPPPPPPDPTPPDLSPATRRGPGGPTTAQQLHGDQRQ